MALREPGCVDAGNEGSGSTSVLGGIRLSHGVSDGTGDMLGRAPGDSAGDGPSKEFLRACSLGARAETVVRVAW